MNLTVYNIAENRKWSKQNTNNILYPSKTKKISNKHMVIRIISNVGVIVLVHYWPLHNISFLLYCCNEKKKSKSASDGFGSIVTAFNIKYFKNHLDSDEVSKIINKFLKYACWTSWWFFLACVFAYVWLLCDVFSIRQFVCFSFA